MGRKKRGFETDRQDSELEGFYDSYVGQEHAADADEQGDRALSAAQLKKLAAGYAAALAGAGILLSPVTAKARAIATSPWGRAWCLHLTRLSDYEYRLPRGRTYLRAGAVIDMVVRPGCVEAKVTGRRLYTTRIEVAPLDDGCWQALRQSCAGKIESALALLQGRISSEAMQLLIQRDEGMFPEVQAIKISCDCLDWADLCKHAAAVLYGIGVVIDADPAALFRLRGVDCAELIATGLAAPEPASALGDADLGALFGIDLLE